VTIRITERPDKASVSLREGPGHGSALQQAKSSAPQREGAPSCRDRFDWEHRRAFGVRHDGLLQYAGFPVSDVTLSSSPTDIMNDISNTLSYDYSSLSPLEDAIKAALTGLPAYDANIATDQLDAGNFINAILDPSSANTALAPYDLLVGAVSPLFAALGTFVNLADLFS
jgi:hypothetical protein